MKRFLTLYKIEQRLFFRSPDVFIFNLCMPVVILLLIGFIAVPQAPPDFWRLSLQNGKKSEHCHFHFILSYAILFWGNHSL